MIPGYLPCTKARRCPICGRGDWCLIANDRATVICPRTPTGAVRVMGDAGFLHIIDPDGYKRNQPTSSSPPRPIVTTNWEPVVEKYERNLTHEQLHTLAVSLRVKATSLAGLRIGFSHQYDAFTFPMYDHQGKAIGVRVRNIRGDKWSATGSTNGLFLPTFDWSTVEEVWVVEGPTDTAAMLDMDFYAIGRPSCSARVQMTCQFLKGKRVTIVSNYDEEKTRPDGTKFYPGQEGTAMLANALLEHSPEVRVIYPRKGKDVRQWKQQGATAAEVRMVAACATPWTRKEAA